MALIDDFYSFKTPAADLDFINFQEFQTFIKVIKECHSLINLFQLIDKLYQWLTAGRWFSPGTPVSFTNKTDHHDITEILLKVALNTITSTKLIDILFRSIKRTPLQI